MNVAIIGAGLIGRKRAKALPKKINLSLICDIDTKKVSKFAKEFNCEIDTDWRKVIENPKIQAIIISTTNNFLTPIAEAAILRGKHVLIEKPGARNLKELQRIAKAYHKRKVVVRFGFNHRYHPAIIKAKNLVDSGKFGKILFIRTRYGHGGRRGYEKEWRFNKKIAGGGELLDQGTHLIDLINFFCGTMENVSGKTSRFFWKSKLEDSAFFILSNKKGQIAQVSVTCVEWKNIFSLEIMVQKAKIQIDGLGGSYGREKLTLYTMKPEMGPPDTEEFLFPEVDISWENENKIFFENIKNKVYDYKSISDALYVLEVVEKLYKEN